MITYKELVEDMTDKNLNNVEGMISRLDKLFKKNSVFYKQVMEVDNYSKEMKKAQKCIDDLDDLISEIRMSKSMQGR